MAWPKGRPRSAESKRKTAESMQKHYANDPTARQKRASFKGRTHSEATKRKMSESRKQHLASPGAKDYMYGPRTTESQEYQAIHVWIRKWFTKTYICELCAAQREVTHWAARVPGKWTRERKDYLELCVSCHRYYDNHGTSWAPV
jgi:hypothetical protein